MRRRGSKAAGPTSRARGRPVRRALPEAGRERLEAAQRDGSTKLDLADCGLTEVPAEVFALEHLEELSLAGNALAELPEALGALGNLRRLTLAGNRLRALPASLGALGRLEGLWCHGNLLEALPEGLGELRALRQLSLSGNRLAALPEGLAALESLEALAAAGNRLAALPDAFAGLGALRELALHGNRLRRLPASLCRLGALETLALQGNALEALPEGFGDLGRLTELTLSDNRVAALPEAAGALRGLQWLTAYNNRLERLPPTLLDAPLRGLWVEANPLDPADLHAFLAEAEGRRAGLKVGVDADQAAALAGRGFAPAASLTTPGAVRFPGNGHWKLRRDPLDDGAGAGGEGAGRALLVAFGSAPGIPNWAGIINKVWASARRLASVQEGRFLDALFVVDPERSWYDGTVGHAAYGDQLAAAAAGYDRVILLGDSMGAAAALTFADRATAVMAFCPQVDLKASAIRPGQPDAWLEGFTARLHVAVARSGAAVEVHTGNWAHDMDQATALAAAHGPKVRHVVHSFDDHRLTAHLNAEGKLLRLVEDRVVAEAEAAAGAGTGAAAGGGGAPNKSSASTWYV